MHPLPASVLNAALAATNKPGKPNGNKPGKNATNKADKADKATPTEPATDDGGLIGSIGGLLWDHKWLIPVLLIIAIAGINYLWKQYRNKQSMRGVAVRPLGPIIKDLLRFARKEDKRPLHAKLPPAITASRLYAALALLVLVGIYPGIPGIPAGPLLPLFLLFIALAPRYSKIARAQRSTLNQMFAVATSECRYPKGSELAPWNYVQISNWTNLIQPGKTVINIPAAMQSEDVKTREKFERNFNGTVSEENAWTYTWESAKNRLVCEPAAHLPGMASYPGPGEKWDEIPVGVKGDGTQAIIPLSVTPHSLVCGPTGSGKSVLQRSVLFHILAHSDTWRLVAIDMKRVEMAWLRKYPQVLKVATDLEEAVEVLRSLKAEMMRRYEEMEEAGVNHAKDLPNPPKAIFCMIDESTVLLAPEGIKTDEGKERDALHGEAGAIMGELGRLSRASMIHVMACFQRPDASFLKGETKANFDCRIAAGRMDTTPSLMVLDSEAANRLPKIKGRGMIRIGGELDTFQGYFAEQSWYDEWEAQRSGGAAPEGASPEDADAGGPVDDDFDQSAGPTDNGAPSASPVAPDGSAPAAGKPARGLKALAAKAAAKAQERAARMDAEAATEGEEWVDSDVVAPGALAAPVMAIPTHVPSAGDAPPPEADGETGDSMDLGFDFDSLLVDVDDFDEDDYGDEAEGDPDEPSPPVAPVPVAPVETVRPVLPQPVSEPVPMYQPGAPLPGAAVPGLQPVVKPSTPPQPPTPTVPPVSPQQGRPVGGLPVQPPPGLPVRPPQPRSGG